MDLNDCRDEEYCIPFLNNCVVSYYSTRALLQAHSISTSLFSPSNIRQMILLFTRAAELFFAHSRLLISRETNYHERLNVPLKTARSPLMVASLGCSLRDHGLKRG